MQDFEKFGVFYLGREHDPETRTTRDQPVLYDSRDLLTHGVIIGMTGSGKTGLAIDLLEEAAIDGVPAIAIDPKGDLGNLMPTFPGLSAAEFRPWISEDEAARQNVELRAVEEVRQARLDMESALANKAKATERVALARENERLVAVSYKAGSATYLESTDATESLRQAEINLVTERQALRTGARFERAEGALETLPTVPSPEELAQRLEASPSVARWQTELAQRDALRERARSERVPDVTLRAGPRRLSGPDDTALVVEFSLPLPLWDRRRGDVAEAEHRLAKLAVDARAARVRAVTELATARVGLEASSEEATLLRTRVLPGTERAVAALRRGYEAGRFAQLELIDAERARLGAREQYLEALAEAHHSTPGIPEDRLRHRGPGRVLGRAACAGRARPLRGPRGPAGGRFPLLQRPRHARPLQRRQHHEDGGERVPQRRHGALRRVRDAAHEDRRLELPQPRHDRRLLQRGDELHPLRPAHAQLPREFSPRAVPVRHARAGYLRERELVHERAGGARRAHGDLRQPVAARRPCRRRGAYRRHRRHFELPAEIQPCLRLQPVTDTGRDLRAGTGAAAPLIRRPTEEPHAHHTRQPARPEERPGHRLQPLRQVDAPKSLIVVSGQVPRDENGNKVGTGSMLEQTLQCLRNIEKCLAAAGATMSDVVWTTVYTTDMREFRQIVAAREEFFRDNLPTSTMVEVNHLSEPGLLVEIQAIAAI